ncbi:MAG: DUF433 domain-containing protein [Planctomycetes bacterium]|nr:DUF433 domain-containing protein [Planctomycetota bacterium]
MQLEDYFEFENFDTKFGPVEKIRVKGHRIGIEHVVGYFKEGLSPETIVRDVYPSLNLEKVYATILYYEANKQKIEEYIRRCDEVGEQYYQEYLQQPESEALRRVKAIQASRQQQKAPPPTAQAPIPRSAEPSVP